MYFICSEVTNWLDDNDGVCSSECIFFFVRFWNLGTRQPRFRTCATPFLQHWVFIECVLECILVTCPPPPFPLNFEICLLPFCLYRNPFRSFVDTSSFYFFSWCQFLNFWWICGTDRRFRVLNIISSRSKWIRGGVVIWKSLCTMIIKNVGMGCSQMTWEKLWSLSIIKYERGDDL